MRNLKIKRLDHHGIVAGVIDDLKIVEIVNQWVGVDEQEPVSSGMIIKSMILNGLGFSSRPLTLSPQLFQNIAMEHLFGPGITPDLFNRHQIGRVLDTIFESDCSALFSKISKEAGRTANVETQVQSLDTTSFSTFGEYPESDDELPAEPQPISITYGHSKDRRPDLNQAVVELIVSQDGGVATFMKCHDRNASDSVICRKRTKALVDEMKRSDGLGVLVADSKLYSKENTEWLAQTEFITPIPSTNKLEKELTMKAVAASEMWCRLPNNWTTMACNNAGLDLILKPPVGGWNRR
jgi:transposase